MGDELPLALSFPGLLDPVEIVGTVAWVRPAAQRAVGRVGIACAERAGSAATGETLERGEEPSDSARPLRPDGFRVLIVEDNPHIIEMYSYVLKKLAANDLHGQGAAGGPLRAGRAPRPQAAARGAASTW